MRWIRRSIAVNYTLTTAHAVFLPCVTRAEDITAIVRHVPLPLNVMCMPELADFSALSALGVKRISMGNFCDAPHRPD
jgi:2-methylisocitrate lyase-like PEP mutase family enzyme